MAFKIHETFQSTTIKKIAVEHSINSNSIPRTNAKLLKCIEQVDHTES